MKDRIKKNFFWNTIGSTLNAMVSLFFMIAVTRINGSDKAGIFTFAFSTSCLLQVIGLYSGRTYRPREKDSGQPGFLPGFYGICQRRALL